MPRKLWAELNQSINFAEFHSLYSEEGSRYIAVLVYTAHCTLYIVSSCVSAGAVIVNGNVENIVNFYRISTLYRIR